MRIQNFLFICILFIVGCSNKNHQPELRHFNKVVIQFCDNSTKVVITNCSRWPQDYDILENTAPFIGGNINKNHGLTISVMDRYGNRHIYAQVKCVEQFYSHSEP